MEIVVLDGYTLNPGDLDWSGLESMAKLRVYPRTSREQAAGRIGTAEIVLTNKTVIDRDLLDACPGIRYIGVLATGYNVVDVQAASERQIPVCNVPSYGTEAVAQHAMALLLELCNHVGMHDQAVRGGQWQRSGEFCFWNAPLMELTGKTMGIVGMGRIGRKTAELARAFGMKVIYYDRNCVPGEGEPVTLQELLSRADVVSLHCPLFAQTERMINAQSLQSMKRGALLINTSRGGLVDTQALAEALQSGWLGGAALDVVPKEPIDSEDPLLQAPNCILTPHIAWAPREARARLLQTAVENVRAWMEGKPENQVNVF